MFKKDSGVSPVIATILMVAITVVLAATVYVMVAGLGGTEQQVVSGHLVYMSSMSQRTSGKVVLEVVLNTPSAPNISWVHIKLLNKHGDPVSNYNYTWQHVASDPQHIKTGDYLKISDPNVDLTDYIVIISIDHYSGTIQCTIPPS